MTKDRFEDEINKLLPEQADANAILKANSENLKVLHPSVIYKCLKKFKEHGADVVSWCRDVIEEDPENGFLLVADFFYYQEQWEKLGINVSEYADKYFEYWPYLEHTFIPEIDDLPNGITCQNYLEHYMIQDIIEKYPNGLLEFLDDYTRANGDLVFLVNKVIKEGGFKGANREDVNLIKGVLIEAYSIDEELVNKIPN